jgi:hypothetical protein
MRSTVQLAGLCLLGLLTVHAGMTNVCCTHVQLCITAAVTSSSGCMTASTAYRRQLRARLIITNAESVSNCLCHSATGMVMFGGKSQEPLLPSKVPGRHQVQ